jgi:hypothetical protein
MFSILKRSRAVSWFLVAIAVLSIPSECMGRMRDRSYRSVAGTKKLTPPMLVTYFVAPGTLDDGSTLSGSRTQRPSFYLGAGLLATRARDSAMVAGTPPLNYGGFSVSALWQPQMEWLIRTSFGYTYRTFALAQDPTGTGQAQFGQNWSGTLSLEYEWLTAGDFRVSSGWSNQVAYGYRASSNFTGPTYTPLWTYKTGVGSTARLEVLKDIDVYAEAQLLLGFTRPIEYQPQFGVGLMLGL